MNEYQHPILNVADDDAAFRRYMDERSAARREASKLKPKTKTKTGKKGGTKTKSPQRRAKTTAPIAFLKQYISPLVYGHKTSEGVRPRLTREQFVGRWNLGLGLASLPNYRVEDHFQGLDTLYFFGNGKKSAQKTLAMIDIDVLKSKNLGSAAGARAFAQHLKDNYFPDLYYETSTNGKGFHAYIQVWKLDLAAEVVNQGLRRLETWLQSVAKGINADIELVEIKGTCPEIAFNGKLIDAVKYGQFAKLPREVQRFSEWQKTTILRTTDLLTSVYDVPAVGVKQVGVKVAVEVAVEAVEPEAEMVVVETSPDNKRISCSCGSRSSSGSGSSSGSVSGRVIGEDELANIPKYESLCREWTKGECLKAGRWAVTDHDFAVAMVILKHCHEEPNHDGSLPYRRAERLWTALFEAGDVERPWNHHRWKVIRDFLSAEGHIHWIDNRYEFGTSGDRGLACKWRISDDYAFTLEVVASVNNIRHRGASFVDTDFRSFIPQRGTGQNLRPQRFPIRAEKERNMWFRAYEACEHLCAA